MEAAVESTLAEDPAEMTQKFTPTIQACIGSIGSVYAMTLTVIVDHPSDIWETEFERNMDVDFSDITTVRKYAPGIVYNTPTAGQCNYAELLFDFAIPLDVVRYIVNMAHSFNFAMMAAASATLAKEAQMLESDDGYTDILEFIIHPEDDPTDQGLLMVTDDQMVIQITRQKDNLELMLSGIVKTVSEGFDTFYDIYTYSRPHDNTPIIELYAYYTDPDNSGWVYILAMGDIYAKIVVQMVERDAENVVILIDEESRQNVR